jgi:hypothetical protein
LAQQTFLAGAQLVERAYFNAAKGDGLTDIAPALARVGDFSGLKPLDGHLAKMHLWRKSRQ